MVLETLNLLHLSSTTNSVHLLKHWTKDKLNIAIGATLALWITWKCWELGEPCTTVTIWNKYYAFIPLHQSVFRHGMSLKLAITLGYSALISQLTNSKKEFI